MGDEEDPKEGKGDSAVSPFPSFAPFPGQDRIKIRARTRGRDVRRPSPTRRAAPRKAPETTDRRATTGRPYGVQSQTQTGAKPEGRILSLGHGHRGSSAAQSGDRHRTGAIPYKPATVRRDAHCASAERATHERRRFTWSMRSGTRSHAAPKAPLARKALKIDGSRKRRRAVCA